MEEINEIRKRLGLKWSELAEKIGYSEKTLRNTLCDERSISDRLLNSVRNLEKDRNND